MENVSTHDESPTEKFNVTGYLPGDNLGGIVSVEVERMTQKVTQVIFCVMFVIGGPANIINMAVFYRQGLKDRVNLCLFALSLSDLLYVVTAVCFHGELTTLKERYGPVKIFMANNNLLGFFGFQWVSQVLSAIIASERCFCIMSPLKFQTLFHTRTMAVIIILVYVVVLGLFFIVAFRYRVSDVEDPVSGTLIKTVVPGELYKAHRELVDYLTGLVFGWGLPGAVIIVVTTTTVITAIRLRQIVTWRTGTSSSVSAREVALTKMLVGNSVFFIACVTPDALFRIVGVFVPEMGLGKRYHNLYSLIMWVLDVVAVINSSFNFFLYYAMGSRYRETFWALFKRKV